MWVKFPPALPHRLWMRWHRAGELDFRSCELKRRSSLKWTSSCFGKSVKHVSFHICSRFDMISHIELWFPQIFPIKKFPPLLSWRDFHVKFLQEYLTRWDFSPIKNISRLGNWPRWFTACGRKHLQRRMAGRGFQQVLKIFEDYSSKGSHPTKHGRSTEFRLRIYNL